MDLSDLLALWHKTPKKLVALAGAAAAGIVLDRQTLLVQDLKSLKIFASFRRMGKRIVAERMLVPDLFASAVQRFPQRICLMYEDRALTYRQVDEITNRIGHWALRQGLKPGDKVALLMENRPEFIMSWLGLMKVGVVSALINTHIRADGLVHSIKIAEPKLVLVGEELLERYTEVIEKVDSLAVHVYGNGVTPWKASSTYPFAQSLDDQLAHMSTQLPPRDLLKDIIPTDTAMLIYTSGTTGLPKAANVNHFIIILRGFRLYSPMNVTLNDRIYCPLPLYHTSGGNLGVSMCFHTGATLCIARKFSVSQFWHDVRHFDATVIQYIGEMCRYLVSAPPHKDDNKNNVRVAVGNGLRPDVWHEFQDRFGIPEVMEFYGSTEGVLSLANYSVTPATRGHLGQRGYLINMLMGAKIVKYDIEKDEYVRDPKTGFLKECGLNETGELLAKTTEHDAARQFQGYYGNEHETNKKILRNVFVKGDAYFRTGDLFKIDSNLCWHFMDRVGDTFRWKGENVATNEVAEAIAKFPGLSDICVYGVQIPGTDGRACMAAMVFDDTTFDMKAFAKHVQARLPSYAAPLFLRQLGEMSVTGTMKYEKAKLRKQGMDPTQMSDKLWYYVKENDTYERLTTEKFHAALAKSKL